MSDYDVKINGKKHEIQKEVFDLIMNISIERDSYKQAIEIFDKNIQHQSQNVMAIPKFRVDDIRRILKAIKKT